MHKTNSLVKDDYTNITSKLLIQLHPFDSFSGILSKIHKDGYLDSIFETFDKIFKSEGNYTLEGLMNRTPETFTKPHSTTIRIACRF